MPDEYKTVQQLTKIVKDLEAFLFKVTKESAPVGGDLNLDLYDFENRPDKAKLKEIKEAAAKKQSESQKKKQSSSAEKRMSKVQMMQGSQGGQDLGDLEDEDDLGSDQDEDDDLEGEGSPEREIQQTIQSNVDSKKGGSKKQKGSSKTSKSEKQEKES